LDGEHRSPDRRREIERLTQRHETDTEMLKLVEYERDEPHDRYNVEYIFAATHRMTDMQVPAALKVPLVPVTLVMDVALVPFEVVAGCF
jgi:uncharacterized protein YceK